MIQKGHKYSTTKSPPTCYLLQEAARSRKKPQEATRSHKKPQEATRSHKKPQCLSSRISSCRFAMIPKLSTAS